MNKVGFCYHPKLGREVADDLAALASAHVDATWVADAWDEAMTREHVPGTDLLVCIGGDGTVLRAARAVVPHETILLGVNLGRLGFLTELELGDAVERLPDILSGAGRVEQRAMLHAEIISHAPGDGEERPARHDALNDVVVGRPTLGRTIQVSIHIDGTLFAEYRADGVIVATATGSTAYSLSAGGPVLAPESREIVLTPLSPHLAPRNAVILPPDAAVEVRLASNQTATLSVDGERDLDLRAEEGVRIVIGPHSARFLRLGPRSDFYQRVARRLNWLRLPPGDDARATTRSQEAPA